MGPSDMRREGGVRITMKAYHTIENYQDFSNIVEFHSNKTAAMN